MIHASNTRTSSGRDEERGTWGFLPCLLWPAGPGPLHPGTERGADEPDSRVPGLWQHDAPVRDVRRMAYAVLVHLPAVTAMHGLP